VQTFANAAARTAAIPTPTEGIVSYLIDTNALELYNNGWNVINPSSGNVIINGGFDIWQRGTSFTGTVYTADRWRGNSATIVRSTDVPNTAFQYSLKLNSSTQFALIGQRVESTNSAIFSTESFTISFWIKANASAITNGAVQAYNPNAIDNWSAQTFRSNVNFADLGLTAGVWKRVSIQRPANAGYANGLGIEIFAQTTQTSAVEFFITGVQLEAGPVATPFRRNAPSIQAELAACQRYFLAVSPTFSYIGYAYSTTNQIFTIPFPVEMRIPPNGISGSALSTFTVFNSSNSANTPLSFSGNVANKSSLSIVVASPGSSIGTPCRFEANSGSAFLHILGAEL
jgi:hypothetical protein